MHLVIADKVKQNKEIKRRETRKRVIRYLWKHIYEATIINRYLFLIYKMKRYLKNGPEQNGEDYFSCHDVWMYVLLPPCTILFKRELQYIVINHSCLKEEIT